MQVIDLLEDRLQPATARSHAIDARLQIFIALNFYAISDFYSSVLKDHGISEASVCRIVDRVTQAIITMKDEIIIFREAAEKKVDFDQKSGFSNVVGAVDCTHVWLDGSQL